MKNLLGIVVGLALAAGAMLSVQRAEATTPPPFVYALGTVRPASVGGPWAVVANDQHSPQNIGTVSCSAGGDLMVNITPITHVVGASVETDERWSRQGIAAGVSVGLTYIVVWFTQMTPTGPQAMPCSSLDGLGNLWISVTGLTT